MFGPLGFPEIALILVLALLIFGPKKLPEVGRTIGKGMAEFRRATSDLKRTIETEVDLEDRKPRLASTSASSAPASAAAKPEESEPD
ncbi:MAG TPA: twin-arginine translocase TatA/TatE family subunit [Thermoanaerobaculia bacterium]|nr:twin-arginine translocase TatA/TatE family subunit [Thermoanaerobaculia bacterium]